MKESTTYQAIVQEGRIEEARKIVHRLGERKFKSPPPDSILAALDGLTDLDRLERLPERILEVETWEEILTEPATAPAPRPTRRKKSS